LSTTGFDRRQVPPSHLRNGGFSCVGMIATDCSQPFLSCERVNRMRLIGLTSGCGEAGCATRYCTRACACTRACVGAGVGAGVRVHVRACACVGAGVRVGAERPLARAPRQLYRVELWAGVSGGVCPMVLWDKIHHRAKVHLWQPAGGWCCSRYTRTPAGRHALASTSPPASPISQILVNIVGHSHLASSPFCSIASARAATAALTNWSPASPSGMYFSTRL
jgi:hypothetical protein